MGFYLWVLLIVFAFFGFWIVLGILDFWMWDREKYDRTDPADD